MNTFHINLCDKINILQLLIDSVCQNYKSVFFFIAHIIMLLCNNCNIINNMILNGNQNSYKKNGHQTSRYVVGVRGVRSSSDSSKKVFNWLNNDWEPCSIKLEYNIFVGLGVSGKLLPSIQSQNCVNVITILYLFRLIHNVIIISVRCLRITFRCMFIGDDILLHGCNCLPIPNISKITLCSVKVGSDELLFSSIYTSWALNFPLTYLVYSILAFRWSWNWNCYSCR